MSEEPSADFSEAQAQLMGVMLVNEVFSPTCNVEKALQLIADGAALNARHRSGTPLSWAIGRGRKEIALALIAAGADLEAQDDSGMTALGSAIAFGNSVIAKALIAADADTGVACDSRHGNTALLMVLKSKHPNNKEIKQVLIAAGRHLDTPDKDDGLTPLLTVVSYSFCDPDSAKALIAAGADLNCRSHAGYTALMLAVMNNQPDIVSALIEKGADIEMKTIVGDLRGRGGMTALMLAAEKAYFDPKMAAALIEKGAKLDEKDDAGLTALDYARKGKNAAVEKMILDATQVRSLAAAQKEKPLSFKG